MNINILIIILLILFPIYILLKKLIIYLINRRKRETVRRHLAQEGSKKTQYSPSHNLKIMSELMSPKYFSNIFYKEYLDVNRYNIGEEISIKDLANLVKKTVKFEGEIYWDDTKPDGTPRKLLCSHKINNIGWEHNTKLLEGIESTYKWYLQNKKKNEKNFNYWRCRVCRITPM